MEGNIIQNARNLFRVSKENEGVKDKRIRDIGIPFESEKENEGGNYYEPVRVCYFYSSNYIEYESNAHKSKTLLIKEYFDKVKYFHK